MKIFSKQTFKIVSHLTMIVILAAYVFYDYKILPYWFLLLGYFVEEATELVGYLKSYLEKVNARLEEKRNKKAGRFEL